MPYESPAGDSQPRETESGKANVWDRENAVKASKYRFEVKTETGMARAGSWVNNYNEYVYYTSVLCQETMVQQRSSVHSNLTQM